TPGDRMSNSSGNVVLHWPPGVNSGCPSLLSQAARKEDVGKPAFSEHDPGLGRNPMEAVAGDGKTKNLK
ncbi:hypothetical protein ACCS78_27210, partial [Rhizobium johnstonii]